MLSIIIKTYNSEDTISETLESIKDLGEIVIIDFHSNDDTVLIAKEYKAKIIYSTLLDFQNAFNQVLSELENEWVLFLDGDEIIPEKLGREILNYIENPKKNKNAVFLPQKLFYLEKDIKASRKLNLKLFKKNNIQFKGNFSFDLKPNKTKTYKFKHNYKMNNQCILKFQKKNICTNLQNIIEKTIINSKEISNENASVFIKPFLHFIKIYFFKKAFLNGKTGFIYSFNSALEIYIFECLKFEKNNYSNS